MRDKNSQTGLGFGALVVMGILGLASCGGDLNDSLFTTTIATPSTGNSGSDSTTPTDETSPTDDGVEDTTKPTNPPPTTIPRTTTSSPPTTVPQTTTSSPPTTVPRTTTSSPPTSSDLRTMACLDRGGRVEIDKTMMMAYCYVNNMIFDRWGIK